MLMKLNVTDFPEIPNQRFSVLPALSNLDFLLNAMYRDRKNLEALAEIDRKFIEFCQMIFQRGSEHIRKVDMKIKDVIGIIEAAREGEDAKGVLDSTSKLNKLVNDRNDIKKGLSDQLTAESNQYSREADDARTEYATENASQKLIDARKVDICIMIDGTGSMDPYIKATKEKIHEILNKINAKYPKAEFYLASVIYRDVDDGNKRYETLDFTSRLEDFVKFLGEIKAGGGKDEPEDINGALHIVSQLNWKHKTRILLHFADAPCHGRMYHDCKEDDYVEGVPNDNPFRELLIWIRNSGIDYHFKEISKTTKKMVDMFQEDWHARFDRLATGRFYRYPLDVDASSAIDNIQSSVLNSLHRNATIASAQFFSNLDVTNWQSHMNRPVVEKIVWEEAESKWKPKIGKLYYAQFPTDSLDVFLTSGNKLKLRHEGCKILLRDEPFAQGSFNEAYPAILAKLSDKNCRYKMVVKRFKMMASFKKTRKHFKNELRKHCICKLLGEAYNQALVSKNMAEKSWASLQFVDVFLLEIEQEIYLLEGYIEGEYVKYSNNISYMIDDREIRHLTSFAHYTYQKSRERYLVADYQGVGLLLTDPVIHSKKEEFIESGDFSREGIVQFFSHHECNHLCKGLGLTFPRTLPLMKDVVKWNESSYSHLKDIIKIKCSSVFCNSMTDKPEESTGLCPNCRNSHTQEVSCCKRCDQEFNYSSYAYLMQVSGKPERCQQCDLESGADFIF